METKKCPLCWSPARKLDVAAELDEGATGLRLDQEKALSKQGWAKVRELELLYNEERSAKHKALDQAQIWRIKFAELEEELAKAKADALPSNK